MDRTLALALLGTSLSTSACRYDLTPEARICDDLAYAVSERTLVCEESEALANSRYESFLDETECLLSDEVDDPYNPEGILVPDDNPEETERLEDLYDCVRAARKVACDAVRAEGDDPAFWIRQHASCALIVSAGGAP